MVSTTEIKVLIQIIISSSRYCAIAALEIEFRTFLYMSQYYYLHNPDKLTSGSGCKFVHAEVGK